MQMLKSVVAIIPARGGSKGIPGKNTRLLNNKPLIAYSIEAAREAKMVNQVYVSTDDPHIAQIATDMVLQSFIYIGSVLTEKLLEDGHQVVVDTQWFGNPSSPTPS